MINNQGQISGFTLVEDHMQATPEKDSKPMIIEEYVEDPNDGDLFDQNDRMRGSQSVADSSGLVKKKSKFSKFKGALGLKKKDKSGRTQSSADGLGLS